MMASEGVGGCISIDGDKGDSSGQYEATNGEAVKVRSIPSWQLESA